jgi:1-acyl-sn-glycerol-3-phosphate acyltransferase
MGIRMLLFARRTWWWLGWGTFTKIWCRRLCYEGLERIPEGPVVLAANHASHADTVVLQLVLNRAGKSRVLFAAAADYWFRNRILGLVARFIGAFSFPRSGSVGIGRACKALRRGWSIVIYPQGSRSGGSYRPGVGLIAARSGAVVVPVSITGTDRLLPKGRLWPRRSRVKVRFGRPITMRNEEDPRSFATRLGERLEAERTAA